MDQSTRALESSLLYQDMRDAVALIHNLDTEDISSFLPHVRYDNVFLTGEGSSRIFPAKKVIYDGLRNNYRERLVTENATQALEYDLSAYTVFVTSNSGKTRECVRLIDALAARGHDNILGVVAHANTPVIERAHHGYILNCDTERAVASTKSVIAQALFFDILFRLKNKQELPNFKRLAEGFEHALTMDVPHDIMDVVTHADTIYFSGRNNGIAEELILKTNEITRKKADYLEGTYALHGVEEVMRGTDAIVVVDPFREEEERFSEILVSRIGIPIVAIAAHPTAFPTMIIPDVGKFQPYLELAAGWNLLVNIGLRVNVNIDRPARARKTGNEYEA